MFLSLLQRASSGDLMEQGNSSTDRQDEFEKKGTVTQAVQR